MIVRGWLAYLTTLTLCCGFITLTTVFGLLALTTVVGF